MTASQLRIAETIDAFYGDSGARDGVSRSYKQAVEDLDAETVKALDGPYRCVPRSFCKFVVDDTCLEGEAVVKEVEKELNFKAGNRRNYTHGVIGGRDCNGFQRACELMDYVYRTTVLEPINRFCAYFPDINECTSRTYPHIFNQHAVILIERPGIKKRQHKMLDYDALRSKVKKLTEKPDKDPSKLPRTEKEMEMVSLKSSSFLHTPPSLQTRTSTSTARTQSSGSTEEDSDLELDLSVPNPPKALQRPEIEKLRRAERLERTNSMSLTRSPSLSSRATGLKSLGLALGAAPDELVLMRSASAMAGSTVDSNHATSFSDDENSSRHPTPQTPTPNSVSRSFPEASTPTVSVTQHSEAHSKHQQSGSHHGNYASTPFFNPSELEDIMQPFKEEFMQRQADDLVQAKAAYEQLNEQLTTELPQLIDLR